MTKEEILFQLCQMTSKVGREVYHSKYAHDCFCGKSQVTIGFFHFEPQVLDYIRDAINEKMEKK